MFSGFFLNENNVPVYLIWFRAGPALRLTLALTLTLTLTLPLPLTLPLTQRPGVRVLIWFRAGEGALAVALPNQHPRLPRLVPSRGRGRLCSAAPA